MEKQLEATLVGGLYLFKNELDHGDIRFMLGSSKEEVFCNGDECLPFGINEETYRILLESFGGITCYYVDNKGEISLEDYNHYHQMDAYIMSDTYFETRDQAFEAAQTLIPIFQEEGPEGLIKYADRVVCDLWEDFGDIGINMRDEITSDFHLWDRGTSKEEILNWFDRSHSQGLATGLMGL